MVTYSIDQAKNLQNSNSNLKKNNDILNCESFATEKKYTAEYITAISDAIIYLDKIKRNNTHT